MDNEFKDYRALPRPHDVDVLRRAFQSRQAHESVAAHDDHWRPYLRIMCDDARARGTRVEQLLISLKRAWVTLPDVERMTRHDSTRLLSRVVTLCVEEYYAPFG